MREELIIIEKISTTISNKNITCSYSYLDNQILSDNVILCIHGWLENKYSFIPLIYNFALLNFRSIALDLPGYGNAYVKISNKTITDYKFKNIEFFIISFIKKILLKNSTIKVFLLGHSLGSNICLKIYQNHKFNSLLEGIILLNTNISLNTSTNYLSQLFIYLLTVNKHLIFKILSHQGNITQINPNYIFFINAIFTTQRKTAVNYIKNLGSYDSAPLYNPYANIISIVGLYDRMNPPITYNMFNSKNIIILSSHYSILTHCKIISTKIKNFMKRRLDVQPIHEYCKYCRRIIDNKKLSEDGAHTICSQLVKSYKSEIEYKIYDNSINDLLVLEELNSLNSLSSLLDTKFDIGILSNPNFNIHGDRTAIIGISNRHIIEIRIKNINLNFINEDKFFSYLHSFKFLQKLHLINTNLTSLAIIQLDNLIYLNLRNNNLKEDIFQQISSMKQLRTIILCNNLIKKHFTFSASYKKVKKCDYRFCVNHLILSK